MKETWTQTVERYIREGRTVSGGKGDPLAKQSEQLSLQNQAQQMQFNTQLMQIFNKQYEQQQDVLNYLKAKAEPMIEHPTGYSDEALAGMRTSASDTIARNTQAAQQAGQAQRFALGSRDLPSGVDDQINAAINDSSAAQQSSAQNQITQANEDLKQKNYWNAMGVLGGTGAAFNPQSYASEATGAGNAASGAGNTTAGLANAYMNSKKGFWTSFKDSLGSSLGHTLGGGNASPGGGWFGMG